MKVITRPRNRPKCLRPPNRGPQIDYQKPSPARLMSRMVNHLSANTVGTVTFDAQGGANSTSSTLTWNHTPTSTFNASLNNVVIVVINVGALGTAIAKITPLTCFYGSVTMTPGPGCQNATTSNTTCASQMWYLINPPTGVQAISFAGLTSPPSFGGYTGVSLSYTQVESVGSIGVAGSTTGTAISTGAIEGFSGARVVASFVNNATSGSITSPSGTSRFTRAAGSSNAAGVVMDQAVTSTTLTCTATGPGSSHWQADGLMLYPTNCGVVGTLMASGTGGNNFNNGANAGSTTLGLTYTSAGGVRQSNPFYAVVVKVGMSITTVSGTLTCGVTYNSVAMTQVDLQMGAAASGNEAVGIYILFGPPTGPQSVVVTTGGTTSKTMITSTLTVYSNCGSYGSTVNTTATSTAPSVTVASAITSRVSSVLASSTTLSTFTNSKHIYTGAAATGTGDYFLDQDRMGVVAGAVLSDVITASGRWRMMGVELLAA